MPMCRRVFVINEDIYFVLFIFSANDNDMSMDEGMSFTIGKLTFSVFVCTLRRNGV